MAYAVMSAHLEHFLSCDFADCAVGESGASRLSPALICFSNFPVDDRQKLFWKGFGNKKEGQSRE